jgi:hypothetical protein
MTVMYAWRGGVTSTELNALHADAFQTRLYTDDGWDWVAQLDGLEWRGEIVERQDEAGLEGGL